MCGVRRMSDFAAFHDELRSVARQQLATGVDRAACAAAGWLGLEVPEAHGGAGATFAETAVIVEELGRAAATTPFLGSVVLGAAAAPADLLAGIADGSTTVAVALATGDDVAAPFRLAADGTVTGAATFVPDATGADHLLLVAADDAGADHLVTADAEVTPTPVLDGRDFATVTADGIPAVDVRPLDVDLRSRGALAVAVDSLGIAEAMLDATVTYVKERHQFDRPIGSFQAVKHQLADALVQVTLARQLVVAAIADRTPAAVAMAKAHATAMAVDVAGTAMQLHGGIGYTWEGPVHVHLKRAMLNRSLFGSPRSHRAGLADRYRTRGAQHG
jgi:alkylation response protein AidB-like acyl-CoA dehydrogenase